jgi:hypothetical protein
VVRALGERGLMNLDGVRDLVERVLQVASRN